MGFETKVNGPRVQVSLNSYGDKAKELAGNAAHAVGNGIKSAARTAKNELGAAASAIGHHAKDAGKTVVHHAVAATPFSNSDLKHNMQHKSGRAIDN
jgi:hypothetical protein